MSNVLKNNSNNNSCSCGCNHNHQHHYEHTNHSKQNCNCSHEHSHEKDNTENNSCSDNSCCCGESHSNDMDSGGGDEDPEGCININNHYGCSDDNCSCGDDHHHHHDHHHHNIQPIKYKASKNLAEKKYILKGLNCAGCAVKIETQVNALEEIAAANLNFTTSTLTIHPKSISSLKNIHNKIEKIVNKLEPDVLVIDESSLRSNNADDKNASHTDIFMSKNKIARLIIGSILFGTAVIFKFSFNVELTLFIFSYLLIGGDIILKALKNISKGQIFDENFLMIIATFGAFAIKEFPEAVAVMLFYQIGESFQDAAVNRSRKSIADLMDIRPDKANLKIGDTIKEVSPEEVDINDIIVVKPGEKIPIDGIILEGKSMLDTSALTGESVPRKASIGDEVLSGFINENGVLKIKVTKNFAESAVSKILDLVENAGSKKAKTEQFITKFARYYTPIVVFSAVALAFLPPIFIKGAVFSDWFQRALIFLVVSCPCALVVSVPLGFFGGIGCASKNGILVKGGNYLEALNYVDKIVFDKTGTLTQGIFEVTEINPSKNISKIELLELAAYSEAFSNHPIAKSILVQYNKAIDKTLIKDYNEIAGHGIKSIIGGQEVLAGNSNLMEKYNISFEKSKTIGTIVYIAVNKKFIGYIVISDKIKKDSKEAIVNLKKVGINETIMLTGDSKTVGEAVAKNLNLDKAYTELLPQNKVKILEDVIKESSENKKVAFVGDGVNDAPVLARADVGIAMGGLGSDAAIEAADIVLMTDEPSKIAAAIKIAKNTRRIVMENIIFALGIKLAVLILAALGMANMWIAVFADVGVALLAVMNSMRVLKTKV